MGGAQGKGEGTVPMSTPDPGGPAVGTHFPAAKALGHRVPASKVLREVAPEQSCPGEIQHRLDKQAITEHWWTASAGFQRGEDGGNFRPHLISEQSTDRPQVSSIIDVLEET